MPDAPLTTLCAICHTTAPKYTCPACRVATCSLACAQRHKAWADCSGRRDPAAFLPLRQLKTAAGVDHDFNFLSAIERARARNQRELVEDRGVYTAAELGRALGDEASERKVRREWFGAGEGSGGMRREADGQEEAGGRGNGPSSHVRRLRARLAEQNVEVVNMPVGMSRQRENTTAWHRTTGAINWCVEWVMYEQLPITTSGASSFTNDHDKQNQPQQQKQEPLRIRHKAHEASPLDNALGASLVWHQRGHATANPPASTPSQARRQRALIQVLRHEEEAPPVLTKRLTNPQNPVTTAFDSTPPHTAQNPHTAAWDATDDRSATASWPATVPAEAARLRGWRFYLLKEYRPGTKPANAARELVPVEAGGTVSNALKGRTVVEYPVFYVLPPAENKDAGAVLPEGFVLGSTARRAPRKMPKWKKDKQKTEAKRNAPPADGGSADEGEVANKPKTKKQQQQQAGKKRKAPPADKEDPVDDGGKLAKPNKKQRQQAGKKHKAPPIADDDVDNDVEEGEIAQPAAKSRRGRGGKAAAVRGRGGRGGGRQQVRFEVPRGKDLEEGEVESGGEEPRHRSSRRSRPLVREEDAPPQAAHTSSSGGGSSDDDDEQSEDEEAEDTIPSSPPAQQTVYNDNGIHPSRAAQITALPPKPILKPTSTNINTASLGLVDYGSSSDDDDDANDGQSSEDDREVDLASLKPEDPELVASAIKEIVGLFTT